MTPGSFVVAIIDDEEDITTYLRIALEDEGYRVTSTTDASTAMEMLAVEKPDLICLDLLMPEQTGVSLYASLVGHPTLNGVPIIILSGLTNREGLPAILEDAGDLPQPAAFIEKPVEVDELLDTVRNLLS